MKILLLGSTGQVGWELNRTLLTLGELVSLDYPEIDMANPDNIQHIVKEVNPNIIINATAYTDVDKAESEPELAMAINGTGPGILAKEAKRLGAALIHYSTDYVFDGMKSEPYTEEDAPKPLNTYGKTKLAGEQAVQDIGGVHLIFRTSWVYSLRRSCFVTKVLEWAQQHEILRIVDDQVSSPTWSRTLAEATAQVIAQGQDDPVNYLFSKTGLYHLASSGSCSRFEWAESIIAQNKEKTKQVVKELRKAKSSEFPTEAKRPQYTPLSTNSFQLAFNLSPPFWKTELQTMFE